eukprot:6118605-Pyramimonas_sp.AAC.1
MSSARASSSHRRRPLTSRSAPSAEQKGQKKRPLKLKSNLNVEETPKKSQCDLSSPAQTETKKRSV